VHGAPGAIRSTTAPRLGTPITVANTTTGETFCVNGGSRDDTAGLGDPAKSFAVSPVVSSVETVL